MKPLRNITNKEQSDYMRMMRDINLERALSNTNENWMQSYLPNWKRQAIKGYRIFDFWNHELLCAVEVDGPEHDRDYDNYRDEYNFCRSSILTLRVRNKNEIDAKSVLACIENLCSGIDRKKYLGIVGNTKAAKRTLSSLPYDKNNLKFLNYMKTIGHSPYYL